MEMDFGDEREGLQGDFGPPPTDFWDCPCEYMGYSRHSIALTLFKVGSWTVVGMGNAIEGLDMWVGYSYLLCEVNKVVGRDGHGLSIQLYHEGSESSLNSSVGRHDEVFDGY